jgi:hypothetical protein
MNYKFADFKIVVILLVGFFASILMGLSSCNDANAQNKGDQITAEEFTSYQTQNSSTTSEIRNAPETEYITISKQALEEALLTVRLDERAKYEKIIKNPHLVSKSTSTNISSNPTSSKTAVKASTNDSNSKVSSKTGLVGTLTLNDDDATIYDVFQGSKGGLYFFRISKETGNEYKAYIQKDSKLYHRISWEQ